MPVRDACDIDFLSRLLTSGALPGETDGLTAADIAAAATLVARALRDRVPGQATIASETAARSDGRRIMRLVVVNDDMPFLVDSIAAAVAAAELDIHRVLHPVVAVERDGAASTGFGGQAHESLIYLEIERADARARAALLSDIAASLDQVRRAVAAWPALHAAMVRDAARLTGEGAALLNWLVDRNFTLLGHARYLADGSIADALGIGAVVGDALLTRASRDRARTWLAANHGPLLIKSNLLSRVHRRAPLDLVIVRDGDALSVHAGLWTSAALASPADAVPMLRERLRALEARLGFDPNGHAGKSLAHAFSVLPHDLLIGIAAPVVEEVALTAMSIADRPRPRLVLATDALDRHLFAFVWLPRDELSTTRRLAIAELIAREADARLLSWSIDMADSGVALIRYTFDRRTATRTADAAALDAAVVAMVRGWASSVEASLALNGEAGRAARLALRWADAFPLGYRMGAGPEEAAADITRLAALGSTSARGVRLYRNDGDAPERLRLKLYSMTPVTLSAAVPALENFGFRVIEELSTDLKQGDAQIHRFVLELTGDAASVVARAGVLEPALAQVLDGDAENDRFNTLLVGAGMDAQGVLLFRGLFRYLRQAGHAYGLDTVATALQRHPDVAAGIATLFAARHDATRRDEAAANDADAAIERALAAVKSIDEDRILRLYRDVVRATLRTNFFTSAAAQAIAFKLASAKVPALPAPVPWREIWVYSPRVEGIHLRAGPIARGGLRWSDRRDDFRTEILGLMKAQRVKNAVIVPTGAKGGFYAKQLPDPAVDRDAWLAEGTESYRVFIRTLLSITDNLVEGRVVHPVGVVIHDGDDPYFVVAADKGTATFSDVANAIALERGFWLGDAFASGGSVGYDHKAMGITAKGAWISVQRHFAELGVDVQTQSIRVVGCGDMSGDVFGNGMLLSRTLKIVAAFDHRHIFIDPDPDPAASWAERARLFALPRSSWADYDAKLLSAGGGVFARSNKAVALSPQARAALGIERVSIDPAGLIAAILKSPVDLIWFGGIGTYVKAASEANAQVGDPANDALRVDAEDVSARVIGEGANLGLTQAARIAFGLKGGRINTDFIDNSAGVDCSDHEVNIKIALNAEVAAGVLTTPDRNTLLASMTDDVAALVLEDNRLQTLGLSIAERGGAGAIPSLVRLIETFEASGRLDRRVEGLPANDVLARRAQEGHGLTRPELAVLLATSKLALQEAVERSPVAHDPALRDELIDYFPHAMHTGAHAEAIAGHRLASEIVATVLANRIVNRMGIVHPFELAEEEGASLGDIAAAFVIASALFDLDALWATIEAALLGEDARLLLFEQVAIEARAQMADLLRNARPGRDIGATIAGLKPAIARIATDYQAHLRDEVRAQSQSFTVKLVVAGVPAELAARVVHLSELDGAVGVAALAAQNGVDPIDLVQAFTTLGAALGIDWAQGAAMVMTPVDPWDRLLAAGLARDFLQMRLLFIGTGAGDPNIYVAQWLEAHAPRVAQFKAMVARARAVAQPTPAMLAQSAGLARVLLAR